MKLKIFQLNMWAGAHFPAIENFLKKHDFDILCFQEVTGIGAASGNILHSREFFNKDCFRQLQKVLGKAYDGQLTKALHYSSNPQTAYAGNAIFYQKSSTLLSKEVLTLYKGPNVFPSNAKSYEEESRKALHLTLQKESKIVHVISAHLAWAPTSEEQPHQRKQNLKLIAYIRNLSNPWILTGDFNISSNQPSIRDLEKLGKDLTKEYGVKNTIDPVNHVSWEKIQPGFPIDYIFVSPDVQVADFQVLDNIHMSDHYGLTATISI